MLLLLLLLNPFSRVWLCATPETAAHQALPSLGFSRQEHWSGLPSPSPMRENEKWKRIHLVVSDSLRPHGLYSLPGSSAHGIFQARVLEWVAIVFSAEQNIIPLIPPFLQILFFPPFTYCSPVLLLCSGSHLYLGTYHTSLQLPKHVFKLQSFYWIIVVSCSYGYC